MTSRTIYTKRTYRSECNVCKVIMKKIISTQDLIPVIIQENKTGEVLMLGYMDTQAVNRTIKTGFVWFWSRSKKRLWMKGERSGNTLMVEIILIDCDNDSLLIKVTLAGSAVCHNGEKSCFYQKL